MVTFYKAQKMLEELCNNDSSITIYINALAIQTCYGQKMFLGITRVLSKSVTLKRHCSRNVRVCSLNKPIDIKPIVQIKI